MSTPAKVAAFVVGLLVLFVAAAGAGRLVGGDDQGSRLRSTSGGHHGAEHSEQTGAQELPGGLTANLDGYAFQLLTPALRPGTRTVSFVIDGPDGTPVLDYDLEHEKEMHLIAVRRDFRGFQHVHPTRAADGTWSAPLDLTAGAWRLFADFNPTGGAGLTLGQDLLVGGDQTPAPDTGVRRSVVVDGYEVTVSGDLKSGEHSMLTLSVSKDGKPVTDLQPYLGAYGHLVALRAGDLAYLHVHPEEGEPGPDIEFGAEVPSPGRYHLYLDFKHGDVVRTAQLELEATRE